MTQCQVPRWGLALILILLSAAGAQADPIPVNWTYDWSVVASVITGDGDSTGGATFAISPGSEHATGSSSITVATLATFSSASADNPDTFSGQGYTMTLSLTDDSSGQSGTLDFGGQLFGSFSVSDVNLSATFLSPTTQQLALGDYLYTVTIGPFTGPTAEEVGRISAHVDVAPRNSVVQTPEPTTLTLAGLGLAMLGLRRWRRRG